MQRLLPALLLLLAFPACADDEAKRFPDPYFPPTEVPASVLPEPAHPGSPEWDQQMDEVRATQKAMPPANATAILDEARVRLSLMTDYLPGHPTAQDHPKLFAWLGRVSSTSYHVSEQAKKQYDTPRPYAAAKDIRPLLPRLSNASYPSGHTTFAYTMAGVLSEVYPAEKDKLFARAAAIARHRVEAGVHAPQDLVGGEALAKAVVAKLEENATYEADRDAVEKEVAGDLKLNGL